MSDASITLHEFFDGVRDGRLTGIRCAQCGALAIPPKMFCPECHRQAWEPVPLSGEGVVDTFTVIRVAPRKFAAEAPYAIALVRLTEGVALLGRVVDIPLEKVAIGLRVRFRPLLAHGQAAVGFGPA